MCVCSRLEQVCVVLFFFLFNLCGLLKPGVCFSFQHIKKKRKEKKTSGQSIISEKFMDSP